MLLSILEAHIKIQKKNRKEKKTKKIKKEIQNKN
jgi:hypothetical protein